MTCRSSLNYLVASTNLVHVEEHELTFIPDLLRGDCPSDDVCHQLTTTMAPANTDRMGIVSYVMICLHKNASNNPSSTKACFNNYASPQQTVLVMAALKKFRGQSTTIVGYWSYYLYDVHTLLEFSLW